MPNIFDNVPETLKNELFETIIEQDGLKIERIVSDGHCTRPGEWLCQDAGEWVLLLAGKAEISYKDGMSSSVMSPGDYVYIPPGREHRVESTSTIEKTVWLAVHF